MDLLWKVPVVFLVMAAVITPSIVGKDSATPADQARLSELAGVLHAGEKTIMPYLELEGSGQRLYVRGAALRDYESGAHIQVKGVLRSELIDLTGMDRKRADAPAPPPFEKGWVVYMEAIEAVTMDEPPSEAMDVLGRCLSGAMMKPEELMSLLCFTDEQDKRLFAAYAQRLTQEGLINSHKMFPAGRPEDFAQAGKDCWLVYLGNGYLLELRREDGKWHVLLPTPGLYTFGQAKMTKQETLRELASKEMKRVEEENEAQLEQRRARYLAVLSLKQRHHLEDTSFHYSGIPTDDAKALAAMSPEEFRKAVLEKLDAPDGLRYRLQLEDDTFVEGKPIRVTFQIGNVTGKPLKIKYRPAVELIDVSNAMTARGAMVFIKGSGREPENPYAAKPSYPLKEEELRIGPGDTATVSMDLCKYYDMAPARYTISSYVLVQGDDKGYWSGAARSEGVRFEVKPSTEASGH